MILAGPTLETSRLILRPTRPEDFEPAKVVRQVEPLRKLLEARVRLSDLRGKLAGNDKLEELLEKIIHDTEKLQTLSESQGKKEE